MIELNRDARVFVAGHRGLVGSAILRKLDVHSRVEAAVWAKDRGIVP